MSLIHQALKKVEGSRQGYGAPALGRCCSSGDGRARLRRRLVPALAALVAVTAGLGWFLLGGVRYGGDGGGRSAMVSADRAPAPARPPKAAAPKRRTSTPEQTGLEYYRAGRYDEAAAEFRAALKDDPADPVLLNNLAMARAATGRTAEAEEAYRAALDLQPGYPEALNNYALLLGERGEQDREVEMLERALASRPEYADAQINLAMALERSGRYADALAHYGNFLRLTASQEPEREIRERVRVKMAGLRSQLMRGPGGSAALPR